MVLIADSGSTKTQWVVTDGTADVAEFTTKGLNPVMLGIDELRDELSAALVSVSLTHGDSVFFYGAGCVPELCPTVAAVIREVTGCRHVEVASDMLGAARALCGTEPGIAAILGTGSNTCYYDGREIVANTPPLGYVLGDEGSGARLGIALANGVLKGYLSAELAAAFAAETGLDKASVIERVYRRPGANVFLASLTRFIAAHIDRAEVDALVRAEFVRFFSHNIAHAYPAGLPVSFVGSLAEVFEPQLRTAAAEAGFEVGLIVRRPLARLADFHRRGRLTDNRHHR